VYRYHLSEKMLEGRLIKMLPTYAAFMGVILLITVGTRILIHCDARKRKDKYMLKGDGET
jgi:hypothetical protein